MPNYQLTKIYYIPIGDNDRYYGHTTQQLCARKAEHKRCFEQKPDRKVYKKMYEMGMTADDIELILVEGFPCDNVEQARARERYWIENFGTLNVRIPTRTVQEWRGDNKEYMKKWREDNNDQIREQRRKYRENNKEQIKENRKKDYDKNKERELEYQKKYYESKKNFSEN